MTERPITFRAPMVRAILAGRKTQDRRALKPQPGHRQKISLSNGNWMIHDETEFPVDGEVIRCPYGQPGDRLWVRETWVELLHTSPASDQPELCDGDKLIEHATFWIDANGGKWWHYDGRVIAYKATSDVVFCDGDGFTEYANKDELPKWRSPVLMPRWASRITLEVVSVRVERLQDISEADAWLEGVRPAGVSEYPNDGSLDSVEPQSATIQEFAKRWDESNGKGSWEANPWVWAIEFRKASEPQ